ncbi:MAG: hypothetical protein DMG65_19610 [Candidatus Angelobacter sp. Gp1-AA117]|nr:MAG: hypothetical protein DMG65_19610 [Candidatus Angelobacter sp. Gp1-AA117]
MIGDDYFDSILQVINTELSDVRRKREEELHNGRVIQSQCAKVWNQINGELDRFREKINRKMGARSVSLNKESNGTLTINTGL